MLKVNENFVKLPASYLFVDINNKVNAFMKEHPEQEIIRLGIGDVTRPLPKAVVEAMCAAAKEMGEAETFRGYGPEAGYAFLREAIAKNDFQARGIDISADEILSATARRATPAASATSLAWTMSSRCATQSTRSMWTPTSWPDVRATT